MQRNRKARKLGLRSDSLQVLDFIASRVQVEHHDMAREFGVDIKELSRVGGPLGDLLDEYVVDFKSGNYIMTERGRKWIEKLNKM